MTLHRQRTIAPPSSARQGSETGDKTLFRHYVYPWDLVERLNRSAGNIALVFGEEGKGLSTEDLAACDYLVTLPTWEGYPIANLSHAVNALLYEIQRDRVLSQQGHDPGLPDIVPLAAQLEPDVRRIDQSHSSVCNGNGFSERTPALHRDDPQANPAQRYALHGRIHPNDRCVC